MAFNLMLVDTQNSNRIYGKISADKSIEINLSVECGCLLYFYHPYNGNGLYAACAYTDERSTEITPIKEINGLTLSLSAQKITLSVGTKGYYYCIMKFPLRN